MAWTSVTTTTLIADGLGRLVPTNGGRSGGEQTPPDDAGFRRCELTTAAQESGTKPTRRIRRRNR
jgi:hypothetical protein